MKYRVMFVCHGNICRSPMAEFVMKDLVRKKGRSKDFVIASCATSREEIGNDIHRGTRRMLDAMNIPYTPREAVQLTRGDYDKWDLLIAMDTSNVQNIHRITGGDPQNKVHLLLEYTGENRSIADPWYTGNFELTYEEVLRGCKALYAALKND